jgi:hypothetical protein
MDLSILITVILTTSLKSLYFSIDNTVLCMVEYSQMDDVQSLLAELKKKGWTNASIADGIGVTVNAVEKWQAGDRNASSSRLILLNQLLNIKRIPKQRRYAKGSRKYLPNEAYNE